MRCAPYAPLVAGGDGLAAPPPALDALRARLAAIYGVDVACLLPVCGAAHGRALAERCAGGAVHLVASPGDYDVLDAASAAALAQAAPLLVVDEGLIEFADAPSLAAFASTAANVVALRSLAFAYGLAGAPCGAAIANPALIAKMREALEPWAFSTPTLNLAMAALDASRLPLTQQRWRELRSERTRVASRLRGAREGAGPYVFVHSAEPAKTKAAIATFGLDAEERGQGLFRFAIGAPAYNERVLAALGGETAAASRRAEIVRDTKETRIVAAVDLDSAGPARIDTGIGYFDHMLEQIALHGGFSLSLTCAGDLHIDAHHSIEDCAIALGQALDRALGERRGIGRFGFLLPMDETEAQVSVDLGGRPFAVFKGDFSAPLIGAYPTEMTAHVFRSLAENLRAAIHVSVSGENDHHKTEACYKAFGRALREALRVHGEATPSTKGVL